MSDSQQYPLNLCLSKDERDSLVFFSADKYIILNFVLTIKVTWQFINCE